MDVNRVRVHIGTVVLPPSMRAESTALTEAIRRNLVDLLRSDGRAQVHAEVRRNSPLRVHAKSQGDSRSPGIGGAVARAIAGRLK